MSLSRGIPRNDEYLIAIAGVYQKEGKGIMDNAINK